MANIMGSTATTPSSNAASTARATVLLTPRKAGCYSSGLPKLNLQPRLVTRIYLSGGNIWLLH